MDNEAKNVEVLNKEIDLIQACISRMAQNSFFVKGWLITLIAVVLALLPESFNIRGLCIVGLAITVCFWYLDAFYLKVEKLYRWKYEWVIRNRASSQLHFYDLNPYNKAMWILSNEGVAKREPNIVKIMLTKTMIPLYGTLLICIFALFINSYIGLF